MYVGSYAICVLNWNWWWLTQDHFLIKHWSQRTHRCSARVVGLEEYSLMLVSRYSTVRSGTLTWHEWGLCSWDFTAMCWRLNNTVDILQTTFSFAFLLYFFFTVTSHERHSISNNWQIDCLFNSLFKLAAKKESKLWINGSLWGESTCEQWIPPSKGQESGESLHIMCEVWTKCWTFSRQDFQRHFLIKKYLCFDLNFSQGFRDNFVSGPSQLEMTLQCNIISHWLGAYTKWSLRFVPKGPIDRSGMVQILDSVAPTNQ